MTTEELFQLATPADQINELKSKRGLAEPPVEIAKKQLDPRLHDVMDPLLRKDKWVKIDKQDAGPKVITTTEAESGYRLEKVARIALAIQILIVKRAVSFLFGNPVELSAEPVGEGQKMVLKALDRILYDIKDRSFNRKVARHMFSCTEVAELWYPVPVDKPHTDYGFSCNYKFKAAILSPLLGDELYPYFDESGDMTAFSRAYQVKDQAGVAHSYFETYTTTERWLWELDSANGYQVVEGFPKKIEIGKIPVVFGCQPQVEWADVQGLIDRLEKLLSNFADTNDYHASPKIFVTGKILGFAKKGEAGSIIEGEKDSSAEYLAWQNAPESVKLEITTLLNLIYTLTQTPDISFESVKGLSAMSGVALKLLFMDAHLKVADHREVFDEYMQRRVNILKAFIATANKGLATDCSALMVEPEITPYMIEDDKAKVDMVVAANGNKPAISQKLSAKILGLAKDPDKDYEQMQTEEAARNTFDIAEPSF